MAVLTLCATIGVFALSAVQSTAAAQPVAYTMEFAGYTGGPTLDWLRGKGFVAREDASTASKIAVSVVDNRLVLEAKQKARGQLTREMDIPGATRVRIEWGVDAFPPGADYDKGVRSEAIMIHVFFGKEKIASGSLFVPDSPYFIGLFLCESGGLRQPYIGRTFKAGGRYVCLDRPAPGKPLVSEFDLAAAFKAYFQKNEMPAISAFAISVDTDNAKDRGTSKSFVKRIEFLR